MVRPNGNWCVLSMELARPNRPKVHIACLLSDNPPMAVPASLPPRLLETSAKLLGSQVIAFKFVNENDTAHSGTSRRRDRRNRTLGFCFEAQHKAVG